jgi:hypothetical protein
MNDRNHIPGLRIEWLSRRQNIRQISGLLQLPGWNGYFLDGERKPGRATDLQLTGEIPLIVDGGIREDERLDISPGQVAAYWYLVDQQQHLQQAILDGLLAAFPELLQTEYQYYDIEEGGFPPQAALVPGFDFRGFIRPRSVSIMELEKEDMAYLHWSFYCSWDEEHGFQLITWKDEVVDIGQDHDPWKIYRHNGTYEEEMKNYTEGNHPVPFSWKKKKWWQFWK